MSTEQKTRTIQEVQTEYQNVAFRAGNLQYEIFSKNKDLDLLNSTMRDLNFEYVALANAAAAAEAAKPAEAPAAAPEATS